MISSSECPRPRAARSSPSFAPPAGLRMSFPHFEPQRVDFMSRETAVQPEPLSGSSTVSMVAEVLVVDDNPMDRLRAGRLIDQDSRCHAIYAQDGTEALGLLADHPT